MKKVFFQILYYFFLTSSCANGMECHEKLLSKILAQNSATQSLMRLDFIKIMAPKERFFERRKIQKFIINRYHFPVYYFESYVEDDISASVNHFVYLLSPNDCSILKKATFSHR
ncbi:hypothetical protein [Halobacteriovorax sp. HLS]|uniref:hypothetical protein n=1 Tax=Halobacteriovorax sp. HLS TaxID=2234000 RepID=UPI000FDC49BD|nr:hypothetical protein [Halobacteriovorax sp. HLS]